MLSRKQREQAQDIMNSLYLYGPMPRSELSRLLGITPATMTEVTSYLIDKGILSTMGDSLEKNQGSRRKVPLRIVSQQAYYLGVEISESKLVFCIADNIGQVQVTSTLRDGSFSLSEQHILAAIQSFLTAHHTYKIRAIGLAVPGHFDAANKRLLSNRDIWSSFKINHIIDGLSLPVFVKNNVKSMALAKMYFKSNHDGLNFVFLNVKRGIFSAYVYQGDIYGDQNYQVGEIGHSVMNPNGEQCECGQSGCLQTYASMAWILKKSQYAYETGHTPILSHLVSHASDIRIEHVLQAYRMGEELIHQIIEQAIHYLAQQINNLQIMIDVETIYIHGKLFEEDMIADKLRKKLEENRSIISLNRPVSKVVLDYNPYFGALGAAALAMRQDFIFSCAIS